MTFLLFITSKHFAPYYYDFPQIWKFKLLLDTFLKKIIELIKFKVNPKGAFNTGKPHYLWHPDSWECDTCESRSQEYNYSHVWFIQKYDILMFGLFLGIL